MYKGFILDFGNTGAAKRDDLLRKLNEKSSLDVYVVNEESQSTCKVFIHQPKEHLLVYVPVLTETILKELKVGFVVEKDALKELSKNAKKL